ncbi:hypothetical protein K7432_003613 [Basidiobolus ranarum]|uniref:Uncharacterized protein n=1 Tax=Basidiobolus ranarum TaxID=34480 RepID=A0ABR2WZN4_9FUNG
MNFLRTTFSPGVITRPISQTRYVCTQLGFRYYSGKSTNNKQKEDWMDAEDTSYVQEAIRSVNEETINIPGETVVQPMGDRETTIEETDEIRQPVSHENVQKDWMSSDEDSSYAKEAIRAASQETFSAPTQSNVHSIHAQPLETSQTKPSSLPKSAKQDWLGDEDSGFADEAVRAVENDTINVSEGTNVQKTSGESK